MSKILVPPTVLLAVSDQFARASDHLEMTKNTLNTQISMMMFTWDGTTRQRFFADFQRARSEMKLTIEHMRVISQELKDIAYKFLAVDSETGELDPRCMAPVIPASGSGVVDDGPKTWGDHAEELWKGVQSGAKILADSITGTTEALIEDPIGTGGQMAYDATIGTVEEVIDTAVWGTKMVFDVGDTREQFDEKWNAEQDKINQMGMSGYLGEKGALFLGGVALRRVGVKNRHGVKHDSGRDDEHSSSGTSKPAQTGGQDLSYEEFIRQEKIATQMYTEIRSSTTDVSSIAKNTGWKEHRIQEIKNHVFYNEQILRDGSKGKFDPDYDMAEAWKRLEKGTFTENDIVLLNHEIFEKKLVGINKWDAGGAHDIIMTTEKLNNIIERRWKP